MIEFEKGFKYETNLSYNKFQRPTETLDEALKRGKCHDLPTHNGLLPFETFLSFQSNRRLRSCKVSTFP